MVDETLNHRRNCKRHGDFLLFDDLKGAAGIKCRHDDHAPTDLQYGPEEYDRGVRQLTYGEIDVAFIEHRSNPTVLVADRQPTAHGVRDSLRAARRTGGEADDMYVIGRLEHHRVRARLGRQPVLVP